MSNLFSVFIEFISRFFFRLKASKNNFIHTSHQNQSLLKHLFVLIILLMPCTLAPFAHSAQITLSWDSNTEPNLSGYKVHYGTSSRVYPYKVNVNKNNSCTISNLDVGKKYYFAVTAYDTNHNESAFSTELPVIINSKNESNFVDLPPGYWAEDAINKIFDAGITEGCSQSPSKYCPESEVKRSQTAIMLLRAKFGENYIPPRATGIFADVPINYWALGWMEKLYKMGIAKGCNNNPLIYCPEVPVDRSQIAIFLLRSIHGSNYTPPPATGIFADVPVTSWEADWIEQLYREGITAGCTKNPLMYYPDVPVDRAQMAVFLARAFGL